jgi:large subunit ribosomal protein L28
MMYVQRYKNFFNGQKLFYRAINPVCSETQKKLEIDFAESQYFTTFAVQIFAIMARVCQITGKVPVSGHKVSHSNIKTNRRFLPNLQTKRFFLAEEDKWITLKVSTEGLRTINKNGLYQVVKDLRAQGEKI